MRWGNQKSIGAIYWVRKAAFAQPSSRDRCLMEYYHHLVPYLYCLQEKAKYKDMFQSLRDVKAEIEHLQKLIQQSRERLVRDFEQVGQAVHAPPVEQHQNPGSA
jgi:hypothetical protein